MPFFVFFHQKTSIIAHATCCFKRKQNCVCLWAIKLDVYLCVPFLQGKFDLFNVMHSWTCWVYSSLHTRTHTHAHYLALNIMMMFRPGPIKLLERYHADSTPTPSGWQHLLLNRVSVCVRNTLKNAIAMQWDHKENVHIKYTSWFQSCYERWQHLCACLLKHSTYVGTHTHTYRCGNTHIIHTEKTTWFQVH